MHHDIKSNSSYVCLVIKLFLFLFLKDMSSQEEGLLIHNTFLQETLDELEKKLEKELEKERHQIHQMKEETQALIQEKSLLEHQIQEKSLSAGGERPGLCVVEYELLL